MDTATTMRTEAVMEMLPIGQRTFEKRKRNHCGSRADTVMQADITMKKMIWASGEKRKKFKTVFIVFTSLNFVQLIVQVLSAWLRYR